MWGYLKSRGFESRSTNKIVVEGLVLESYIVQLLLLQSYLELVSQIFEEEILFLQSYFMLPSGVQVMHEIYYQECQLHSLLERQLGEWGCASLNLSSH